MINYQYWYLTNNNTTDLHIQLHTYQHALALRNSVRQLWLGRHMETAAVVFHQSTDVSSSPLVPSVSPATKQIRQSYIPMGHIDICTWPHLCCHHICSYDLTQEYKCVLRYYIIIPIFNFFFKLHAASLAVSYTYYYTQTAW